MPPKSEFVLVSIGEEGCLPRENKARLINTLLGVSALLTDILPIGVMQGIIIYIFLLKFQYTQMGVHLVYHLTMNRVWLTSLFNGVPLLYVLVHFS